MKVILVIGLCNDRYLHKLGYDEKKKKFSKEAKKGPILCKKTWGIQPWPF